MKYEFFTTDAWSWKAKQNGNQFINTLALVFKHLVVLQVVFQTEQEAHDSNAPTLSYEWAEQDKIVSWLRSNISTNP